MIHVFSSGISKIQNLEIFLQDEIKKYGELTFHGAWESPKAQSGDLVIGWGHKKTAEKARVFAHKHALPYLALEDGFLRSLRLGVEGEQPLSLSFDRTGAYYDAGSASDLEAMLNNTGWGVRGRSWKRRVQPLRALSFMTFLNTITLPPLRLQTRSSFITKRVSSPVKS